MKTFLRGKKSTSPVEDPKEDQSEMEGFTVETTKIDVTEELPSENEVPLASEQENDWFQPEGELAIDVYQTEKDIVIQSAIAGIRPEELDVSIENDVVTISGIRGNPNEDETRHYFHEECFWGPFSRQIFLPEEVNINNVEASMKDGIFTLRLPKAMREQARKVKIERK